MRLMIVEDNPALLQKLATALNGEMDITVTGACSSAEHALQSLQASSPEVVLMDIGLPGMSGIELIRAVRERMPGVEMIAHTVFDDKETVFSAIKAGASGYILKGSKLSDIIDALHAVQNGGAPMSPKIARKVIREFQDQNAVTEEYLLTPRERDIVKEIEKGMSYKQIGEKFGISVHTVNSHIKNTYKKLQAKDRGEALTLARKKGII